eukprot:597264-Pyramimonas_sp.AAC.1
MTRGALFHQGLLGDRHSGTYIVDPCPGREPRELEARGTQQIAQEDSSPLNALPTACKNTALRNDGLADAHPRGQEARC